MKQQAGAPHQIMRRVRRKPLYTEGGNIMLVEAIVLGVAMAMYVGAEWTAEDVEDK